MAKITEMRWRVGADIQDVMEGIVSGVTSGATHQIRLHVGQEQEELRKWCEAKEWGKAMVGKRQHEGEHVGGWYYINRPQQGWAEPRVGIA